MPFCPDCGTDIGAANFCPNCGAPQGTSKTQSPQIVRVGSGIKYDDFICIILCCCLSPIAAVLYYLLTDHDPEPYRAPKICPTCKVANKADARVCNTCGTEL